jgi:hypothetical protein
MIPFGKGLCSSRSRGGPASGAAQTHTSVVLFKSDNQRCVL